MKNSCGFPIVNATASTVFSKSTPAREDFTRRQAPICSRGWGKEFNLARSKLPSIVTDGEFSYLAFLNSHTKRCGTVPLTLSIVYTVLSNFDEQKRVCVCVK